MMNAAIAMEGLQRDSQAEWKHKRVIIGSSSHPQAQNVQVVRRVPYQSSGGQLFRQPQQTYQAPPLSIVHHFYRCNNSLRDNRFCLVRGRGTSLVLVSSVAKKATMLGCVHRTSLRSLPSR